MISVRRTPSQPPRRRTVAVGSGLFALHKLLPRQETAGPRLKRSACAWATIFYGWAPRARGYVGSGRQGQRDPPRDPNRSIRTQGRGTRKTFERELLCHSVVASKKAALGRTGADPYIAVDVPAGRSVYKGMHAGAGYVANFVSHLMDETL